MSQAPAIPELNDVALGETLMIVDKKPDSYMQDNDLHTQAFREEQCGWITAMYTELINDVMGVIPDEDVCKLVRLYETSLDIISHATVDKSKISNT